MGISRFDEFGNLATQQDPINMKNYLLNEAGFDYVHLLTEDKVTTERVRQIMVDDLRPRLGDNDRLLFYWSGHGATMQSNQRSFGYLPLAHSKADEFGTMLDMTDLAKWDTRLNAKQTFYLLDACFSGGAGVTAKSSQQNNTLKQIARPSRQILTAGLADEETIVLKDRGTSVFTLAVLEGLRGKADFPIGDYGKDGIVSARELELYVKQRVDGVRLEAEWKKSITPLLTRLTDDEGDFFFFSPQTVEAAQEEVPTAQVGKSTAQSMSARQERLPFEPVMVDIPAGTFTMGCVVGRDDVEGGCDDDEKPSHEVTVKAFQLAKTEVTIAQFRAFVDTTNYKTTAEEQGSCYSLNDKGEWSDTKGNSWRKLGFKQTDNDPVACVSWNDAQAYIQWLKKETGKPYRLPSEAEWEYAARAGSNTAYSWGSSIGNNRANCYGDRCGDSYQYTAPVASYAANSYGLHDMHGNVWEWVADCYANYASAPSDSTVAASTDCSPRVFRGGSWFNYPQFLRSALRDSFVPAIRSFSVGFRVAAG